MFARLISHATLFQKSDCRSDGDGAWQFGDGSHLAQMQRALEWARIEWLFVWLSVLENTLPIIISHLPLSYFYSSPLAFRTFSFEITFRLVQEYPVSQVIRRRLSRNSGKGYADLLQSFQCPHQWVDSMAFNFEKLIGSNGTNVQRPVHAVGRPEGVQGTLK